MDVVARRIILFAKDPAIRGLVSVDGSVDVNDFGCRWVTVVGQRGLQARQCIDLVTVFGRCTCPAVRGASDGGPVSTDSCCGRRDPVLFRRLDTTQRGPLGRWATFRPRCAAMRSYEKGSAPAGARAQGGPRFFA
jgi:hypothetical protein